VSFWLEHGTVLIVGTKAERHAARERVSACHQAQLAELLSHVTAAIDRYRAGEIDAYAVDETIRRYHRAGGLWKFCFARGGGQPRGVHRRPPRRHVRRRRNHRLAGTRHTAATPVITTLHRPGPCSPCRCGCHGSWPGLTTVERAKPPICRQTRPIGAVGRATPE
jgi:hypothetical protein